MPNKIDKQKLHLDKLAAKHRNVQTNLPTVTENILPESEPGVTEPHLASFPNASKEEILCEYAHFLRTLPPMIEKERKKLIDVVKDYLNIGNILDSLGDLNFDNLLHTGKGSSILDNLSIVHGSSFKVLCPPVTKCLLCEKNLTLCNKPTQVAVHTLAGPELHSKYTYRCFGCHLEKNPGQTKVRQDVYYHHDRYGNRVTGWLFYKNHPIKFIKASNEVYLERKFLQAYLCSLHHSWTSMEGQAESYNDLWWDSNKVETFRRFLDNNPSVGRHFDRKIVNIDIDEIDLPFDKDWEGKESGKSVFSGMHELHRKSLSQAVFTFWVYEELKDREMVSRYFFGPYYVKGDRSNLKSFRDSVEEFLEQIESMRVNETYKHEKCTDACKKRGCGNVWSTDGLWKLSYQICMCSIKGGLAKNLEEFIPNICTETPAHGQAFCSAHCAVVSKLGYPTELRAFLKSCGTSDQLVDPDAYSKPMRQKVDGVLNKIADLMEKASTRTTTDAQGTTYLLRSRAFRSKRNFVLEDDVLDECNKETGVKMKLHTRSHGILATVRGGGHIEHFAPLFKSESPTQVAMILIRFLSEVLKEVDPLSWDKIYLSYDNMCNVDRLKVLRDVLPLDGDFAHVWLRINKVIDQLHLPNHKRPECKTLYAPERVLRDFPDANLMVCEQTFSWMGRLKKILNSMPRLHFLFVLHRLVIHRNRYTARCQQMGKYPLLPSAKVKKTDRQVPPPPDNA